MRLQRMAILFLVMALVVGLEVVLMNSLTSGETASVAPSSPPQSTDEAATSVTTPTAVPTVVPTIFGYTSPPGGSSTGSSGTSSGNNSSGNNSSSSATKRPSATKAPTPKPTQAPPPTQAPGTSVGSGSFSSNTGTNLNMSISWEARDQGNDKCRVYITGKVNSYRLDVSSKPISISFGGYSTSVTGSKLDVSSNSSMTTSNLFSTYMDVPSGTEGTMTVSWRYNGTYSDVEIDEVVASGSVWTS